MATLILKNPLIAVGDVDASGDLSSGQLDYSADEVDDTRFGMDTHVVVGGLKSVSAQMSGRWEGGDGRIDQRMFDDLSTEGPLSFTPTRGDGDRAYLMRAVRLSYSPGASVGERLDFEASVNARGDLVRGRLLHDAQQSASGAGTAVQVGAVGSGEALYAALHVVAASGTAPTLDVTVESDDASGFASPVGRIAFAQATGRTAEFASLAGPIADDFYRVSFALGGTNPDFTFVVTLGVL